MLKAAQAYFQTQVQTTSQGQLLLMLYDGAIKFLKQAKVKMEEKDYAEKGLLISRAIDVISELDGSLNVQKGGELATNLHNLYFFCNTRLLQANMKMDIQLIDDVIDILSSLRGAFAEISDVQPATPQGQQNQQQGGGAKVTPMPQNRGPKGSPGTAMDAGNYAAPRPVPKAGQQAPAAAGSQAKPAAPAAPQQPQPAAKPQAAAQPQPAHKTQPAPKAQAGPKQQAAPAAQKPQTAPQQQAAPKPQEQAAATPPQAAPANGDAAVKNPAPANGSQQEADSQKTPNQSKSKLLAGSNIYRKMAMQQQQN